MKNVFSQVSPSDFDVPQTNLDAASFDTIMQIVFAFVGFVALIALLLASLKYVTSQGDAAATAKAKNTIIYSLIGLAIAASAFSIVTFVVKSL